MVHVTLDKHILLARQMSRAGKKLDEIQVALGWSGVSRRTAYDRLRRAGITTVRLSDVRKRAHFGEDTTIGEECFQRRKDQIPPGKSPNGSSSEKST